MPGLPVPVGSPSKPDPSAPVPTGNVLLSAPYVLLREPVAVVPDKSTSGLIGNPGAAGVPTKASFEVDANQIDVQGLILFSASAPNSMYSPGFARSGW